MLELTCPKGLVLSILGAALFTAPAAAGVVVEFDPRADFSTYRTYSWLEGDPARMPEVRTHLAGRIDEQLAAAGLQRTETNGDLKVAIHVGAESTYQEVGSYWRSLKYDVAAYKSDVRGSTEATLIVDLVDATANRAIWQGRASETLLDYGHEKMRKKADQIVKKMFRDFPPPAAH